MLKRRHVKGVSLALIALAILIRGKQKSGDLMKLNISNLVSRSFIGITASLLIGNIAAAQSGAQKLAGVTKRALVEVDQTSGFATRISGEGLKGFVGITQIARDSNTGKLYAFDINNSELVLLDPATGGATPIGGTGFNTINSLAYNPNTETLYALNSPTYPQLSQLLTLNTSTGLGTVVRTLDRTLLTGLVIDSRNNSFYAIDGFGANDALVRINLNGTTTNQLLTGLVNPQTLTLNESNGIFYTFDISTGRLYSINPTTQIVSSVGMITGSGGLQFRRVYGLAYDPSNGRLHAVDTFSPSLLQVNPTTPPEVINEGGFGFNRVKGLALNPFISKLYGTDTGGIDRLLRIDLTSGEGTILGSLGTTFYNVSDFQAIAFDSDSRKVYGVDDLDHKLYRFSETGGVVSKTAIGLIRDTVTGGTQYVRSLAYIPTTHKFYGVNSEGKLIEINKTTAVSRVISQLSPGNYPLRGLTYHPTEGALYGATETSKLVKITTTNTAGSIVATLAGPIYGMDVYMGELIGTTQTKLVGINRTTGQFTTYGEVGYIQMQGFTRDDRTNTYYATSDEDSGGSILLKIDGATNRSTSIGITAGYIRVDGLAFDPTTPTGTLYGVDNLSRKLLSINTSTAQPTVISNINFGQVKSLAFDPIGHALYGADRNTGRLVKFSSSNWAGTAVGESTATGLRGVEGLEYDPDTGFLYGSDVTNNTLLRINKTTGVATIIGTTAYPVNGLARK